MHSTAQARERGIGFAAASFSRREAENRPESFAAGEQAVTHRLVDGGGRHGRLRQKPIERAIDFLLPGDEVALQIHAAMDRLKLLRRPWRRTRHDQSHEEKSDRGGEQAIAAEGVEHERLDVEEPERRGKQYADGQREKLPGPRNS